MKGDAGHPPPAWSTDTTRFFIASGILVLLFSGPLLKLARLSLRDELASYTLLIPFISGYLIWLRRDRIARAIGGVRWPAIFSGLAGIAVLAVSLGAEHQLSLQILSLCLFLWTAGFATIGSGKVHACVFPALFLLFMVPLPAGVVAVLESFFQHASADLAFQFIDLSGTAIHRDGLVFIMPRIAIEVAPECSGIRSSLVLFILSMVAGNLFLSSNWKRLLLAAFVVPLGIVRNAFRVFVLSMLCVHVDTSYIDSPIHHQGGPLFFALSLVPFFFVLVLLKRSEGGADQKEKEGC